MAGRSAEPDAGKRSRNLYVFGATSFFNDTATEMAYWILPAFLLTIGAGPAKLGLIEGIAESVSSFAKLFSGLLTDRVGPRKPLVVAGYTVANVLKPVLAVTTAWWQVLLVRFGDRLAKGVRGAPRDVMLAESVPQEKIGSAFGLLQAMDSAGAIAGPAAALFLLGYFSFRGVFWAAAVPGALAILIAIFGIRETGGLRGRGTSAPGAEVKVPRVDGTAAVAAIPGEKSSRLPAGFYYLLFAVGLFSLGNSSDMFLVLRAHDAGIATRHAPLLGLVFNVTYTAVSWPAGRLADLVSKRAIAAGGYLVFAAVYFVFALAPSAHALWAAMACYGLFYALTNPVLRALVAQTAGAEMRGRAFGIFFFVTSVAALLASVITGELWKYYGARLPFYLSAGLAAIAAGMLLVGIFLEGEQKQSAVSD
ncbi:MAG TPA: MFS transporter [Terriglobales bacterium]|jgi:MFS family permease|nr:MFS transporter [Terriglobales bacterium]